MNFRNDATATEDDSHVPSHVLVPMDGSPLAEEALAYALDVFDCPITVLNVVTPLDSGMSESGVLETDEGRIEAGRDRAERFVDAVSDRETAADRSIETAVETGDPADQILAYAETGGVDHVVMGGHGEPKTGTIRRLLGTVATTVVGESPVPVTVVR